MNIFIESLFVAYFVAILFIIYDSIFFYFNNIYLKLFIIGFFKHLIGYYSGIESYYCKIHYNNNNNNNKIIVKSGRIISESIIEGFIFIYIGLLIRIIINKNNYILGLMIGFTIHIIFEYLNLHKIFIKNNCVTI